MGKITRTVDLIFSGFFSIGFVVLAIITMLPAQASKPNLLGYFGVCAFAPISTTILLMFSAIFFLLTYKMFKRLARARMAEIVVQNEPIHSVILEGN